jgi:hypothetical protein
VNHLSLTRVLPLQIAALTSILATVFSLPIHLPLDSSLYPPPGFLIFIILIAVSSVISTTAFLIFVHESSAGKDRLVNGVTFVVPRNLLVLVIAQLVGDEGVDRRGMRTAFGIGTALLVWANGSISDDDESEETNDDSIWTRRARSSSNSSSLYSPPFSRTLPPPCTTASAASPPLPTIKTTSRLPPLLNLLPFLPFLLLLFQNTFPSISIPVLPSDTIPTYYANRIGLHNRVSQPYVVPTLDIVFSHFDEDLVAFDAHVTAIRKLGLAKRHRTRVIVYTKDIKEEYVTHEGLESILGVDEVVLLPNVGREGEPRESFSSCLSSWLLIHELGEQAGPTSLILSASTAQTRRRRRLPTSLSSSSIVSFSFHSFGSLRMVTDERSQLLLSFATDRSRLELDCEPALGLRQWPDGISRSRSLRQVGLRN